MLTIVCFGDLWVNKVSISLLQRKRSIYWERERENEESSIYWEREKEERANKLNIPMTYLTLNLAFTLCCLQMLDTCKSKTCKNKKLILVRQPCNTIYVDTEATFQVMCPDATFVKLTSVLINRKLRKKTPTPSI